MFLGIGVTAAAEYFLGFPVTHEIPKTMTFEREFQPIFQQQVVERRSAPFGCKGRIAGLHAESPCTDLIEVVVGLVPVAVRAHDQLRRDQQRFGITPYAVVVTEIHLRGVACIFVVAVGTTQIFAVEVARIVVTGRVGRLGMLLPVFGEIQDRGVPARVVTFIGVVERLSTGSKP